MTVTVNFPDNISVRPGSTLDLSKIPGLTVTVGGLTESLAQVENDTTWGAVILAYFLATDATTAYPLDVGAWPLITLPNQTGALFLIGYPADGTIFTGVSDTLLFDGPDDGGVILGGIKVTPEAAAADYYTPAGAVGKTSVAHEHTLAVTPTYGKQALPKTGDTASYAQTYLGVIALLSAGLGFVVTRKREPMTLLVSHVKNKISKK